MGYAMRPIEVNFEDKTFRYDQLERSGNIAIYSQTHKASSTQHYEVIKIRTARAYTWPNGHVTPESEFYPSARTWGQYGWTFHTLAAAKLYAEGLVV